MQLASRLFLLLMISASLSACIIVDGDGRTFDRDMSYSDWEDIERDNRAKIARLNLGADYGMVLETMGQAHFTEAFERQGDQYQILYYRTHRNHSDGDTTKDETTPLVFKNRKLIGWGTDALQQINMN